MTVVPIDPVYPLTVAVNVVDTATAVADIVRLTYRQQTPLPSQDVDVDPGDLLSGLTEMAMTLRGSVGTTFRVAAIVYDETGPTEAPFALYLAEVGPPADPWLTPDQYKAWARIADTTDDVAIGEAVAASMEAVEQRAPHGFVVDEAGQPIPPPAQIHQAGLLLTNRLMSRRNSPDGVVGVSDMGTATILSYDADINMLLTNPESVVA